VVVDSRTETTSTEEVVRVYLREDEGFEQRSFGAVERESNVGLAFRRYCLP